ncbi:MAG: hypothetical protein SFW67_09765 [Myxococcaceae bacterium]|nr:hypothetical protein [Myxococcaceae bacterium]
MASTLALLRRLTAANVDFVLVGGLAAIVHGSSVVTEDAEVCLRFDEQTLSRLFRALEGLNPRERMNAARPSLGDDPTRFVGYRNLYLMTDEGVLDLLGEIVAVGAFDAVRAASTEVDLGEFRCRVLSLEALIACKRALGRPKDLRVVSELEAVLQRLKGLTHGTTSGR